MGCRKVLRRGHLPSNVGFTQKATLVVERPVRRHHTAVSSSVHTGPRDGHAKVTGPTGDEVCRVSAKAAVWLLRSTGGPTALPQRILAVTRHEETAIQGQWVV